MIDDKTIGWAVSVFFVLALLLAGVWDITTLLFGDRSDTVSDIVRESWLRFPCIILACGFIVCHFWKVR